MPLFRVRQQGNRVELHGGSEVIWYEAADHTWEIDLAIHPWGANHVSNRFFAVEDSPSAR
jgi:hypothetical protein